MFAARCGGAGTIGMIMWLKRVEPTLSEVNVSTDEEKVTDMAYAAQTNGASTQEAEYGGITVIRSGAVFNGRMRTSDDVHIEGVIEGELYANSVTVAEGAVIRGTISADLVRVRGTVEGTVECVKLQIDCTGHVSGDIHHALMVVEAGAIIDGNVYRSDQTSSQRSVQVVPINESNLREKILLTTEEAQKSAAK